MTLYIQCPPSLVLMLRVIRHSLCTERHYLLTPFPVKHCIPLLLGIARGSHRFQFQGFSRHITLLAEITMEQWYAKVRNFKDESESSYLTQAFARTVFMDVARYLRYMSKDRKLKFKQRLGPEFEQWVSDLSDLYPEVMVKEMIEDDEFWKLTIELAQ